MRNIHHPLQASAVRSVFFLVLYLPTTDFALSFCNHSTLEDVISDTRHRLAKEYDDLLFNVKLAADNRLDGVLVSKIHIFLCVR